MGHLFKVGETYKNRDGEYEVVRINNDQGRMIIRYVDSGDEVETSIKIQSRIWQNLRWEYEEERKQRKESEVQYHKNYGADFTGLQPTDFKTNTEGTTWRSRQSLAGSVAVMLTDKSKEIGYMYTFISWAIYRWQVAFLTHLENYNMAAYEMGTRKIKYTVEVDNDYIYYGLYIEKSNGPMDFHWDWTRLIPKLKERKDLRKNIEQAESEGIRFIGRKSKGTETFHFSNGLYAGATSIWNEENPSQLPIEKRLEMIEEAPNDYWAEIYLIGMMPKTAAIGMGEKIVDEIAGKMALLLPIYKAAAGN